MKELRGPEHGSAADGGDLVDRLEHLAARAPDHVLYIELFDGVTESARLTAADLRDRAAALAAALDREGIRPGQVVLLIATPPLEFLVGLLGCMWAGVIAAPIAFPRRPEHVQSRLEPVCANAVAVAIVAAEPHGPDEASVLSLLGAGTLPVVSISNTTSAIGVAPARERDIAYLQYTSGSTSVPRGVIVGHDTLLASLDACRALLDYRPGDVNVSWCPLTHDMGIIMGALPSIMFEMTSVLMPPMAFIRRPMTWLHAIDRYRGTHGYSPNFGYDLCVSRSTEDERAALDLSCVRSLFNGAEPVRPETRDRLAAAFAVSGLRPDAHAPGWGLAEACVAVSTAPDGCGGTSVRVDIAALERRAVVLRGPNDSGARDLCADGMLAPGFEARIVDTATSTVLPAGRVGELWLRGPSVCRGYWHREQETRDTFGGLIAGDDGGPYLRTGDLAFLHDGEIVICGRAKDLIIIRGRNIHPQDVEYTAELAHPAVRTGGTAAFAVTDDAGLETIVMLIEVDGDPDEAEVVSAIRAHVSREFELNVSDILIVGPYTVPKTSSGKKQRSASRELWQHARTAVEVMAGAVSTTPR